MFSQCFGKVQERKNEISLPKRSGGTQSRRHGGGFGGLSSPQTNIEVPRRVARNFDRVGANKDPVSTFKYIIPLGFKASSIKCAFFLALLFLNNSVPL